MRKRGWILLFACCCGLALVVFLLNMTIINRDEKQQSRKLYFNGDRKANVETIYNPRENEVDNRYDPLLEALYGEERKKIVQKAKEDQQNLKWKRSIDNNVSKTKLLAPREVLSRQRSNVIIVTNRRSGSSFLGQIFNQNSQVYFHYEPLKSAELLSDKINFAARAVELLRQIFRCDLSSPSEHLQDLADFLNNPNSSLHRLSSNALTQSPYCSPRALKAQELGLSKNTIVKKFCSPLTLQDFGDLCTRYRQIVVKTIRLSDINRLIPLLEDGELNLKILHLVRDPRAIFNSRANSEKLPKVYSQKMMEALCQRMSINIEKGDKLVESGRYMRLRFEDIARDPVEMAKRIYNFTYHQDLPSDIKIWLRENTREDDPQKTIKKTYSTKRNSSHIAQAWRWELPFETCLAIQDSKSCRFVLNRLSYREIESKRQLADSSISLA